MCVCVCWGVTAGIAGGEPSLTELVEALRCLGDLPAAALQLALQPLAQVQDADDPAQQVTGHLWGGARQVRQGGALLVNTSLSKQLGF